MTTTPYKGLAAFDDTDLDALRFFGRDSDSEVIAANLLASRFTILYGPAGVGKSSVLRAGVVRRVRSLAPDALAVVHDSWADDAVRDLYDAVKKASSAVELPDHEAPLADRLSALVDRIGGRLYLVLDQFEEVFTYSDAAALAGELSEVVTRPKLRVNVLLALREDALADLDVFTGRIPDVFGNYLALDRLDRAAGSAAITGPIARYNELFPDRPVQVEPDLVEAVLDEVEVGRVVFEGVARGAADTLRGAGIEAPYLQLVMQRLWEAEQARGSPVLRRATLEELGGAQEIVRSHLDDALGALAPGERDVAARVFHHLVTPSGTKIAHAVDDLAQYAGVRDEELRPVLTSLGADRILRPLDGRFEIFHDVLADAVLAWRTRHEAERAREAERAQAERRQRRLLVLVASSLVAVAAMAAVTAYALIQRADARSEARRAKASELQAEASVLIPVAPVETDPELGLALAAEAARQAPSVRAADILRRALLLSHLRSVLPERSVTTASFAPRGPLTVGTAAGEVHVYAGTARLRLATLRVGRPVTGASTSADGSFVLTTESGGPARLWRRATGTPLRSFGRAPTSASFSPDASLVLTVETGGARIWRADDGSAVATLRQPEPLRAASFGPGGRLVATIGSGRIARVFAARTGRLVATVDQGGGVTSATITPSGRRLVTTGKNRTARIWTLRGRGRLVTELKGHRGRVTDGVVSADGELLVTTSTDGTTRVWALASGQLVTDLLGHTNHVEGAAFSRDGRSVVTWSTDGTARVWNTQTGATRVRLSGPGGAITSAAFDRSGDAVLTTSADRRARIWRARVDAELRALARVPTPTDAAAFSADGSVVAVAARSGISILRVADGRRLALLPIRPVGALAVSRDGSLVAAARGRRVSVWRVVGGEVAGTVQEQAPASAIAFSPDARRLALGTVDGTIHMWMRDEHRVTTFAAPRQDVTSLSFSPSGDRLAAGLGNGAAAVWRVGGGRRLFERLGHRKGTLVSSVAFAPDGRQIVTAGRDSTLRVRSAATGEPSYVLRGHFAAVSGAAFSPDGHWVVSAGPGSAGLWDLPSRQRLLFLEGHTGLLLAASFDAAGRRIATVGVDGTLRAYACDVCGGIPELLRLAERRLAATGREFTPAERRRYFGVK